MRRRGPRRALNHARTGLPYLNCPNCLTSVYSAAVSSTVEECPRCVGILERRIPMFSTERRYEAPFGFRVTGAAHDEAEQT